MLINNSASRSDFFVQIMKKVADVPAAACSKPVPDLEKSDAISYLLA